MIFRVRSATPADANGIARVQVDTWRTTYGGIVPDAHLDALSYRHRESVWQQIISRKRSDESHLHSLRKRMPARWSHSPAAAAAAKTYRTELSVPDDIIESEHGRAA